MAARCSCTKYFLSSLLIITTSIKIATAQAIDYSQGFRSAGTERSFRFSYENDFFSASDRDYTQGVYLELISPALQHFPLTKLGWRPRADLSIFGIALETNGYTPNHIDRPEIQESDRPYASTLTIRSFNTAIRSTSKERITNTLTLGVLGPLAGGKEIQESIHRWIGYTKPLGWHNQVRNEPILNYQLNYEKKLAGDEHHLLITTTGMARAGTLSTKAAAGLAIMTGSFLSPFSAETLNHKRFHIHVYDQPMLNFIGYDATLQGGLINKTSPYTIPNKDINRIVFQNRFGLVVNYRRVMLEYWQSFLTREYKSGIEPKTGGVQIAFRL